MKVIIRAEKPGEETAIRALHDLAFSSPFEGELVDNLRSAGRLTISRVAIDGDKVVGHIALSPVTVGPSNVGLGLAPLGVLPESQRQSIGSNLVLDALGQCAAIGTGIIVVLGAPEYYGRFGFKPAANWNLIDEYDGGAAFQAIALDATAIPAEGGLVKYSPEFSIFAA
ncbi:MAG: N-acetyltransferase [Pirellulales bacterium]|nr:N-acetyltransferase [Pirellulales bacterium]